jgi:shikimate dehydrogenase
MSEVNFIHGGTRLYATVGDPIEQVRSPQAASFELMQRGVPALQIPLHIPQAEFDVIFPQLLRLSNVDGYIITIPFKARALAYAQHVGAQAAALGVCNVLARRRDGSWAADMLDGLGCIRALSARGVALHGKRLMLVGLGGAGSAIAAALASQQPALLRITDLDTQRCERLQAVIAQISPATRVEIGPATTEGMDILLNATPLGMLQDGRLPIAERHLPHELVVFDAVVVPEITPLLALAQRCGCTTVRGVEMMQAQIPALVDFLLTQNAT